MLFNNRSCSDLTAEAYKITGVERTAQLSNAVSTPPNETKLETPLSLIASTGLVNSPRKDQVSFFILSKGILSKPPYENRMGKKYSKKEVLSFITVYSS